MSDRSFSCNSPTASPAPKLQARVPLGKFSTVGSVGSSGLRYRVFAQRDPEDNGITVAAVPEGMPLVATLAQAASARRLTNYGALVRVPRSVEALGRFGTDRGPLSSLARIHVTVKPGGETGPRPDEAAWMPGDELRVGL